MDIIEKKLMGRQVEPEHAGKHKNDAEAQTYLLTYQIALHMLGAEAILETVEVILRKPMITYQGLEFLVGVLTNDVPIDIQGRRELLKIVEARKKQGF